MPTEVFPPVNPDQPIDDPLDPPRVVARGLGVSTQTLANWRCTGRVDLPFVKINRMVRYRRSKWRRLAGAA
jgi:predicted site-specific integrase-resolvase